jgi:hypothetical protein
MFSCMCSLFFVAIVSLFRAVFWVILPCRMIVDWRFRGVYCLHHQGWRRQYAPLKRRSTIILHGSITQKTALNIILAAVRTWNLMLSLSSETQSDLSWFMSPVWKFCITYTGVCLPFCCISWNYRRMGHSEKFANFCPELQTSVWILFSVQW